MGCRHCKGEYVVGDGGTLECARCGYVIGDITLLFEKRRQYEETIAPHALKKKVAPVKVQS